MVDFGTVLHKRTITVLRHVWRSPDVYGGRHLEGGVCGALEMGCISLSLIQVGQMYVLDATVCMAGLGLGGRAGMSGGRCMCSAARSWYC